MNRTRKFRPSASFWEATRIALDSLRKNKLRSFLTLLGIILATTTLIAVTALIHGMNLYIAEHVANLGVNTFVLAQFQWGQNWEAFVKAQRTNRPIRIEDYEDLSASVVGALFVRRVFVLSVRMRHALLLQVLMHNLDELFGG